MNTRQFIVKVLHKTRLNKLAHKIYYKYVHGFDTANPAVLEAQDACFRKSVELGTAEESDYLEFGLFKGYSFWHAQNIARQLGVKGIRFFGFDSFAGLPPVHGVDETDEDVFYEGQYACSKEDVVRNLDSKGVNWDQTFLIEGYYEDSLKDSVRADYKLRPVSIALIDCDLYESTRQVLAFIEPLVADGTILMMDDWNCYDADPEKGQQLAMSEFLQRNARWRLESFFSYGAWGQVFIIREKPVH